MIRRTLWDNTIILTIAGAVMRFGGLVWTVYLGRTLGADVYGSYVAMIALVSIMMSLSDFGIGLIGVRETAANPDQRQEIFGIVLILRIFLGAIAGGILIAASLVLNWTGALFPLVLLSASRVFLMAPASTPIIVFQGAENMLPVALTDLGINLGSYILGILALKTGFGLRGVFWVLLLGSTLGYLPLWVMTLKRMGTPRLKGIGIYRIFGTIKSATPIGISSLAIAGHGNADRIILNRMMSPAATGWFNGAGILVTGFTEFFWTPYSSAIFPLLSRLNRESRSDMVWLLKRSSVWFLALTLPLGIGMKIWARPLILFLFPKGYEPAVLALDILCIMLPFRVLRALWGKALIVVGREDLFLWLGLVSVTGAVVLDLILIPFMQIRGAAVGAAASEGLAAALAWFWVRRCLWPPLDLVELKSLVAPLAAFGISALVLNHVHLHGIWSLAVSIAVFLAAAVITKTFDIKDFNRVRSFR